MNILQALILSAIEGIAEFLPISSTGHMVLASELLKIQQTEFVKSFEIIIQLGAILAVVVLYWKRFTRHRKIWERIVVAFIPTGIVGFLLYKFIKQFLLGNDTATLLALFWGGVFLIVLELFYKEREHYSDSIEKIPLKTAFFIGLFQSVAVIPGVSRAAATIISALYLGTKRKTAVEFSFLLAVPTMLAATGFDLIKTRFSYSSNEYLLLGIGLIGSFVVALLTIKFLLGFIKNHTFIPFGVYRVVLALLFFLLIVKK